MLLSIKINYIEVYIDIINLLLDKIKQMIIILLEIRTKY